MNEEYIWFFGPCAVGKRTTIRVVGNRQPTALDAIVTFDPVILEDSLHGDTVLSSRFVASAGRRYTSLLIKVQWKDLMVHHLPIETALCTPQTVHHKAVFMYCDSEYAMRERYVLRSKELFSSTRWRYRPYSEYESEVVKLRPHLRVCRSLGFRTFLYETVTNTLYEC